MKRIDSRMIVLLHALDEGYDKPAWHGHNLRGAVRGVTFRQASWRPGAGRHSIREVVVHAAYWKHLVRKRLTGRDRESFPIAGSNWLKLSAASEKAWQAERALLEREHRALRQVVAAFPAARLDRRLPGTARTALREIAGIALHDVYHTGQIQLLKALQKSRRSR